jgi:hypothetical protein
MEYYDTQIKNIDKSIEELNNNKIICEESIIKLENKISTLINKSENNLNKCWFCKKIFCSKQNIRRHINETCNKKKLYNNDINKIIDKKNYINDKNNKLIEDKNRLIEEKNKLNNDKINMDNQKKALNYKNEIKLLRNEISKLIKIRSINNMNNNMNNINITNNKIINTNNNLLVNINSFGKESLEHITINDYKKFLGGYFPGFIKFIEKVHFDINAPENHNISITNLKSKYLHVYENNKWTTKEKVDVLNKFINKKFSTLIDKCEELEERNELSEKIIEDFMQFTQNYKDDEAQKNTQKNVILMMYNNKDKVDIRNLDTP